jgi:hypothetical protein
MDLVAVRDVGILLLLALYVGVLVALNATPSNLR